MSDENQDDKSICCCEIIDKIDNLWEENKYKISGKFSIGLSILAGVAGILSFKFLILSGIALSITNVGVFFAGISLEKFKNEQQLLKDTNESLRNEKNEMIRRFTTIQLQNDRNLENFEFPISNEATGTPHLSSISTATHYDPPIRIRDILNRNLRSSEPAQESYAFSQTG